jgi:hypothetical protein
MNVGDVSGRWTGIVRNLGVRVRMIDGVYGVGNGMDGYIGVA